MTDARFPERWLNDRRIARLSDAAFRAFVLTLTWSVGNRTEGVITPDDLELVPRVGTDEVSALVAAGLWEEVDEGWCVIDFVTTQTSRSQLDGLDQVRAGAARRSKAYRERKASASRDSSRDDKGQDRPGQDRPDASRSDSITEPAPRSLAVVPDSQPQGHGPSSIVAQATRARRGAGESA